MLNLIYSNCLMPCAAREQKYTITLHFYSFDHCISSSFQCIRIDDWSCTVKQEMYLFRIRADLACHLATAAVTLHCHGHSRHQDPGCCCRLPACHSLSVKLLNKFLTNITAHCPENEKLRPNQRNSFKSQRRNLMISKHQQKHSLRNRKKLMKN